MEQQQALTDDSWGQRVEEMGAQVPITTQLPCGLEGIECAEPHQREDEFPISAGNQPSQIHLAGETLTMGAQGQDQVEHVGKVDYQALKVLPIGGESLMPVIDLMDNGLQTDTSQTAEDVPLVVPIEGEFKTIRPPQTDQCGTQQVESTDENSWGRR
ncbi:uncharacterized protein B0I36DRAFT_355118 [Microdochium trichocladiopsis]|uniref:Uncharacterized protein n=1 Tax=Microdochium trichocladiopsis TaxID=1682393 RepID=A0A9P8XUR5_9PEZI|nr:uncharacterized protein B0I36DRAFT_355118 [Microdochium trichocladiopsis]KAH7016304.1 hypothetical protein B0I36DRAFT_355118 [Microdochium trichocladiopsis]